MTENIPQLTIELEENGTVLLEQEWCGETDRIQLHSIHIRYLAELSGLLEPVTRRSQHRPASQADEANPPPSDQDETLAESYFAAP